MPPSDDLAMTMAFQTWGKRRSNGPHPPSLGMSPIKVEVRSVRGARPLPARESTAVALWVTAPDLLGRQEPTEQAMVHAQQVLQAAEWLGCEPAGHLRSNVLESVRAGSYALFHFVDQQGGRRPVAILSYTRFSIEAEARYRRDAGGVVRSADWGSGSRLWILGIVSPYAELFNLRSVLLGLLGRDCVRYLSRPRAERPAPVVCVRSRAVPTPLPGSSSDRQVVLRPDGDR